jgi:threonine dehydrogenase-like Zn-dependent dehydrogenase
MRLGHGSDRSDQARRTVARPALACYFQESVFCNSRGGVTVAWQGDEAFEAVCSGRLDVRPMLGRTVGLDEVPEALDASRDASGPARIIVVP